MPFVIATSFYNDYRVDDNGKLDYSILIPRYTSLEKKQIRDESEGKPKLLFLLDLVRNSDEYYRYSLEFEYIEGNGTGRYVWKNTGTLFRLETKKNETTGKYGQALVSNKKGSLWGTFLNVSRFACRFRLKAGMTRLFRHFRGAGELQYAVCLAGNHVELLFASELDEAHSVAGNADREVLVFFLLRVFHGVLQLFDTEYVHVQVVAALAEIAVEHLH